MKVQSPLNLSTVTEIDTKYLITTDKSLVSLMEKKVDLKKGDIIQGMSIVTRGDMSNDSGAEYLVFKDKDGNEFRVPQGFRGFIPFYEEYKGIATPTADVAPPTFFQEHKNHLLLVGALVLGYLAYKKFNK